MCLILKKIIFLLFLCAFLPLQAKDFWASELGVISDGKTLNTAVLQKAVDRVAQSGGGSLRFSPGTYLTGGFRLKSGVTLYLEEGAVLKGSDNPYDYFSLNTGANGKDTRNDNGELALILAENVQKIGLDGKGTIDGNGLSLALHADSLHHTGEYIDAHYNARRQRPSELVRPKLIFFSQCSDISIKNLHFQSSANWGLSFDRCTNLTIQGVDVLNRAYWNNDGIDLTDCKKVLVQNCKVNAADDGICLKSYQVEGANEDIHICQCEVISSASAVKFGTGSWGAFRNIEIDHIRIRDTFRSAIAIESVDGAQIENIRVHDIHAENTGNAIFIRLGQRAGERKGSIRNVEIKDFYCDVPFGRPDENYDLRGPEVDFLHNPFPSSICGIPGNRIENIQLENVEIHYPGRATKGMAYMPPWRAKDVPEQVAKSPEFSMFGELPSWGFYLRHVDGLSFKNVKLELKEADFRPMVYEEDVLHFIH